MYRWGTTNTTCEIFAQSKKKVPVYSLKIITGEQGNCKPVIQLLCDNKLVIIVQCAIYAIIHTLDHP
jgi:hypothetical protein